MTRGLPENNMKRQWMITKQITSVEKRPQNIYSKCKLLRFFLRPNYTGTDTHEKGSPPYNSGHRLQSFYRKREAQSTRSTACLPRRQLQDHRSVTGMKPRPDNSPNQLTLRILW
ncbi:hypothetical protein TNCV_5117791 [Trichonephila clavipes]|nr:hypothetical protein TNCV_5117791 [Trichonephila clavipes]